MQRQEQSDCEHKDPKDDSIPMPPFRENDYGLNLAERASDDVTITKLRENDVLLGRGSGPSGFEGNVRFRKLIRDVLARACNVDLDPTSANDLDHHATPDFDQAALMERNTYLASTIVETITARNGRFLIKSSESRLTCKQKAGRTGSKCKVPSSYVEVDESVAIEKTKQTFRHQLRIIQEGYRASSKVDKKHRASPSTDDSYATMIGKKQKLTGDPLLHYSNNSRMNKGSSLSSLSAERRRLIQYLSTSPRIHRLTGRSTPPQLQRWASLEYPYQTSTAPPISRLEARSGEVLGHRIHVSELVGDYARHSSSNHSVAARSQIVNDRDCNHRMFSMDFQPSAALDQKKPDLPSHSSEVSHYCYPHESYWKLSNSHRKHDCTLPHTDSTSSGIAWQGKAIPSVYSQHDGHSQHGRQHSSSLMRMMRAESSSLENVVLDQARRDIVWMDRMEGERQLNT